uniref:Uma2 family endonuclease n=1 Tax=uncultured Clostridium sp. TaxID=59620 RepID=UPI0025ED52D0
HPPTPPSAVLQRRPRISIICDEEKIDEKGCYGAPDFIVEIVSPGSRKLDYYKKLTLYQETGVREYWIVAIHEW